MSDRSENPAGLVVDIRVVIFDVDGVLIDSLQSHLDICRDKSRQYGLGLPIPTAREFKDMVRRGVVVSPMEQMFRAVGFSETRAKAADADYRRDFAGHYPRTVYPGVPDMLSRLARAGIPLGLVSANTRTNIESTLGTHMAHFDARCQFTVDDGRGLGKAAAIARGAVNFAAPAGSIIYVGDQPADHDAARTAGAQFLGVTYGWGFSEKDTGIPIADTPAAVATYILDRRMP